MRLGWQPRLSLSLTVLKPVRPARLFAPSLLTPIGSVPRDPPQDCSTAQASTELDFGKYKGHGLELDTGTSAEGWAFDAIDLWENNR